jgi:hypothetical protein
MRKRFTVILAMASAVALLAAPVSYAKQTHLFIEDLGSAGEVSFGNANGLALEGDGDLLVIDVNAKTVSRFNPDGTPDNFAALGTNVIDGKGGADLTPQNGFTFDGHPGTQQVAVDNSGTVTDGNIYVTQGEQAAGNLIDTFSASGEYLGQLTAAGATKFGTSGFPLSPCGVAVDGAGNLFAAGGYENKIHKFDPTANPPVNGDHVATFATSEPVCNLAAGAGPNAGSLFANTFFTSQGNSLLRLNATSGALEYVADPGEDRLVAVDPTSGHVFAVGDISDFGTREFAASSPSLISEFPSLANGIAVDGASGNVYLSQGGAGFSGRVQIFGPLVTVPDAVSEAAEITGDTSVRLHGSVNPDGEPLTECFFEYDTSAYGDSEAAGKEGEAAHGQTVPCEPAAGAIGADAVAVQADLAGLTPETQYHFRLVAKNANAALYPNDPNSAGRGTDQGFRTPGKPNIKAQWALDVVTRDATLRATINPENSPTTYRIEWGTSEAYGNATGEIAIDGGEADKTITFELGGLEPDTTYHWRTVASNGIGVTEGENLTFTTFAPFIPNADCPNQDRRYGASASLPDCRAYEMVSPVDKAGTDIFCANNGVELNRVGCWTQSTPAGDKLTYTAPRAFGDSPSAKTNNQYIATRTASGWSSHGINPPQGTTIFDPSLQTEELKNHFRGFTADLSTAWLVDYNLAPLAPGGREGFVNVYRRDNAIDGYKALSTVDPLFGSTSYEMSIKGFSEDGSRVFANVPRRLTTDAATHLKDQIYEISGGKPKLISLLPNGNANPDFSRIGSGDGQTVSRDVLLDTAVSEDGSRVFWTSAPTAEDNRPGRIYLHIDGKTTVAVSGSVDPGPDFRFWAATPDGETALFSGGAGEQLYRFDVATKTPTPIAGGTIGVAGASEDLSHVYFTSTEALVAGASAGQQNLYLADEGEIDFIAMLNPATADFSVAAVNPIHHFARVSADGSRLAFMSSRSLTDYDNADTVTAEPAAEVYLYDAEAEELHCASCNPSGSRPMAAEPRAPFSLNPSGQWAAAWIPTWPWSLNPLHPLSEDGNRLFFNSYDALLPRDTNGVQDVYQWEAPGSGDCEEADGDYFPQNGGCIALISSGQSPQMSEFAEASPDGESVFFTTASGFDPADPGLIDIYVARVGGGYPLIAPPNPCLGDACQGVPPAPHDPTPASAGFRGAGNVKPVKPRPGCPKGSKRRARRASKARCVSNQHKRKASANRRAKR